MKNSFLSAFMLVTLSTCTMHAKAETLAVSLDSNIGVIESYYTSTLAEGNVVTVTVNAPGTFAQALLSQIGAWSDVEELTVIGKLNDTDLGYLSRLKNVTKIDLSQTDIKSIKGCNGLTFLKHILLPTTVVEVQSSAFEGCSSLTGIDIPNTKTIGGGAFRNCVALTSVSLPAATSIGDYAFENCKALTSVSLPAATSIGGGAFRNCDALTSVSLPAATSIGDYAFYSCDALTSVSLPAATSIGDYAFYSCYALKSITLPTTLQFIGDNAFQSCI